MAQALVCRRKDRAPCGECPSCVRAKAGSHPDIRVVEGSGATRSLTVEQVKELTADAYRAPEEADVSVYILQMGTKPLEPAQNKLLKLIEEPPAHGVFLLLCRSAEQLLPTIRSRVQSFLLQPPEEEEAAAFVAAREDVPLERARELARLCGGNIGRMLQELAGGEEAQAFSIAVALAQGLLETGEHPMLLAGGPPAKGQGAVPGGAGPAFGHLPGRPGCCGPGGAPCWGARPSWRISWGFAHEAAYPSCPPWWRRPARAWSATPTWRCW